MSIGWTAAGKWTTQLFSWACSLLIARLLSPEDFGLLTMTTVFLGLIGLLAAAGIGATIVNLPSLDTSQIGQLNSISVGFGAGAALLVVSTSTLVAGFFKRPELIGLLQAMSIPLFFSGLRSVPDAVLQKALRFRLLSAIETAQGLVQTLITLVFAWLGLRYWSLAIGAIAGSTVATFAILWFAGQGFGRPRLAELFRLASFSSAVLISSLSWFAYSNADFLIAGKMLGATALGHYSLAWNLAVAPGEKIAGIIFRVTPGFLAKHSASAAGIRFDVCRLTKGISMLVFPLAIGLALVADIAVPILLGSKWLPAVAPLRYLCIYLPCSALFVVLTQAAVSAGKPVISMLSSLSRLLIMPPAFYIGSHWQARGIAIAWLIAGLPLAIPLYIAVSRRIGLTAREYCAALRTPLFATFSMAVAVVLTRLLLGFNDSTLLSLVSQVAVGGFTYILVTLFCQPRWLAAIRLRLFPSVN